MKKVFEADSGKKAEIVKILEADPYADVCFARNGYKLKDGSVLGEDAKKAYLYLSAADDFFSKFADEKLKGLCERCKPELEARIIKKIEEEEDSATSGFGAIFG